MMKFEADPKELKAAGQVGPNAQLAFVRLMRVNARNSALPSDENFEGSWKVDPHIGRMVLLDGAMLVAATGVTATLFKGEPGTDDPLVSVDVEVEVGYLLPPPPIPEHIEKEGIPAFVKWNALYNGWPYLREKVQSLTTDMGFPLTLPLIVIQPAKPSEKKAAKDAHQPELSGQSERPARVRKAKKKA